MDSGFRRNDEGGRSSYPSAEGCRATRERVIPAALMLDALIWYIAVQVLGILALPTAFVLFRRLPDRGFTLAKPAAMVFFSYIL